MNPLRRYPVRASVLSPFRRSQQKTCAALVAALCQAAQASSFAIAGQLSCLTWFAGSGLAMAFVGLLNLTLGRDVGRDRFVSIPCYAANLLTLVSGLLIVTLDREPQVIFGLVLIVLMTVTAFMLGGARSNST